MNTTNPNAIGQRSKDATRPWKWSIAMYAGDSPLRLKPAAGATNPVISAADVTDVPARFVADPFMLHVDGLWHMFFEVLNNEPNRGEIGRATSLDGLTWRYERIVLQEPFHLSYPCVFQWKGEFYMVPETLGAEAVRLYRATSFPDYWTIVKDLVPGKHADPSIFFRDKKWWLYTCPTPHQHDTLNLYVADDLFSSWSEHPLSPIISGNKSVARPGGRVLQYDGRLVRFTQDCVPTYGKQVRAFEITELTAKTYQEHEVAESPVLAPDGSAWNVSGMHHVDAHRSNGSWLACVDGLVDF
ncbi:MAG TPA: hypothetical protein VH724_08805 [Candidatus Angelobacter sp.]|nr:hypothetical protein [Candidatus Angelobacter sp.]